MCEDCRHNLRMWRVRYVSVSGTDMCTGCSCMNSIQIGHSPESQIGCGGLLQHSMPPIAAPCAVPARKSLVPSLQSPARCQKDAEYTCDAMGRCIASLRELLNGSLYITHCIHAVGMSAKGGAATARLCATVNQLNTDYRGMEASNV